MVGDTDGENAAPVGADTAGIDSSSPMEVIPVGDWLLGGLVRLANKGLVFPVTLSVGGLLISGQLIGGKEYLKAMGELMAEAYDGDVADGMRQWIESWNIVYEEPEGSTDDPFSAPAYIHLRAVKYFVPGQIPIPTGQNDLLWRGRLAAVDGFNWGILREGPANT